MTIQDDITDFSPEALRLRLARWLATGGEDELRKSAAAADRARHEIREALRPDPETLRMPMTM